MLKISIEAKKNHKAKGKYFFIRILFFKSENMKQILDIILYTVKRG